MFQDSTVTPLPLSWRSHAEEKHAHCHYFGALGFAFSSVYAQDNRPSFEDTMKFIVDKLSTSSVEYPVGSARIAEGCDVVRFNSMSFVDVSYSHSELAYTLLNTETFIYGGAKCSVTKTVTTFKYYLRYSMNNVSPNTIEVTALEGTTNKELRVNLTSPIEFHVVKSCVGVDCGQPEDKILRASTVNFVTEEKLANRLKAALQNAAELSGSKKEPF